MSETPHRRFQPTLKRIVASFALATVCITGLTGCAVLVAGSATGVGAVAYIKGELKDQLAASPSETRAAISEAVQRLELEQIEAVADNLSGDYAFQTGSDERIVVRYEKISDRRTEITIRVGVFGDENLSRVLLDEIKQGL